MRHTFGILSIASRHPIIFANMKEQTTMSDTTPDLVRLVSVKRRVRLLQTGEPAPEYDAIMVVIGDLYLHCDVGCARDIKLAKRLAESHGCPYYCEPAVWERYSGGKELA